MAKTFMQLAEEAMVQANAVSAEEAIRELRVRLLRKRLEEAKYNQRKAAQRLGLTYDQFRGLYRKLRHALE